MKNCCFSAVSEKYFENAAEKYQLNFIFILHLMTVLCYKVLKNFISVYIAIFVGCLVFNILFSVLCVDVGRYALK